MRTVLYLDMWIGERIQEMKLAGIRRFAHMAGWDVVPVGEAESRPSKLKKLLKKHQPDGVIVECSASRKDLPPHRFGLIPVVYLDCSRSLYGPAVARVVHDYKLTPKMAYRALASNRPAAFGFVGYREKRVWSVYRERAFAVLAREAGETCRVFPWKKENAENRFRRLADWTSGLPAKSAVFAANDDTAREVVQAAKAVHRAIPHDFTLLGVDNLESVCENSEPSLSSIQVDFERAGFLAARLLNELILKRDIGGRVEKFGPLMTVHRGSTRGYGRKIPSILAAVERIRREACNGLTAADVVRDVRGSRRLFEMRFRETMGHSILDEIQSVRFEKVFYLLAETEMPISTIASFCGYRSYIALRKAFRLHTGMSLAEWRKRNRRI